MHQTNPTPLPPDDEDDAAVLAAMLASVADGAPEVESPPGPLDPLDVHLIVAAAREHELLEENGALVEDLRAEQAKTALLRGEATLLRRQLHDTQLRAAGMQVALAALKSQPDPDPGEAD